MLVGASSHCWSRPPAGEPPVVSARGSPAHPRPARIAAGSSCGRSVRSRIQVPGPGPPLPAAPQRALSAHPGHPGDSRPSHTHPSAVVPIRSRPAPRRRTIPQQLRATPRQATTTGPPLLRALTRVPSGATPARRPLQLIPDARTGAVFPLKTGALFSIGITYSKSGEDRSRNCSN